MPVFEISRDFLLSCFSMESESGAAGWALGWPFVKF